MNQSSLFFTLISLFSLFCFSCDQQEQNQASPLDEFQHLEASAQFEGFDTGKYDQATSITVWNLKESEQHVLLEGLNAQKELVFGAIMTQNLLNQAENDSEEDVVTLSLIGRANCELSVHLSTFYLENSNCDAEQMQHLEIAAEQLIGSLSPVLAESQDSKADGLFSKIACVGAGVGATVLSLIVWHFASSVAIAGASVSTAIPIFTASSSVLGAIALCYNAFSGESTLSLCVSDCDEEIMCVESCVSQAKSERLESSENQTQVSTAAGQLLQCVGACDEDEACLVQCSRLVEDLELN